MQEKPRTAAVDTAASCSEQPTKSKILASKVAQVQQEWVDAVVEEHFIPFVQEHADSGIAKATLVLLLGDTHGSERRSKKRVWYDNGRADVGFCQYAWLGDDDNQKIFWRQPQVLNLLDTGAYFEVETGSQSNT